MNLLRVLLGEGSDSAAGSMKGATKPLDKLLVRLTNCRLLRPPQLTRVGQEDLWIRNGIILDPEKLFFEEHAQADVELDCDGCIIAPGFIETQINGAFGVDFSVNDAQVVSENVRIVAKGLLEHGVTAFCPTLVSSEAQVYANVLPHLRPMPGDHERGATMLGVHLEGPFISKEKQGAHVLSSLRTFDNTSRENCIKSLEQVYGGSCLDKSIVSIVTIAPELDPHGYIIDALVSRGIVVSLGHSAASFSDGERAVKHGARFITHLFNAMHPFHHRDPNLIGLLSMRHASTDSLYYGIIADNIHSHPSAINIAYCAHPEGLVLVTDAMSAMGLESGRVHQLGAQRVEIVELQSSRAAYLHGTRTLAGSVATMLECVRNLISATGCGPVRALQCASEHPAKLLRLYPRKGSLDYGADADLVCLDDSIRALATFIAGDLVWLSKTWMPKFKLRVV